MRPPSERRAVLGFLFSEFTDYVDEAFGAERTEAIIEAANLPSGGAYTAYGHYDYREMVGLVTQLSRQTGTPVPIVLQDFGETLFGRLRATYPAFFEEATDLFTFLAEIETRIHADVRRLYPNASPPHFDMVHRADGEITLVYRSHRCLADLVEGLIRGCADHFGEQIRVDRQSLSDGGATDVEFSIRRQRLAA